eukprot:1416355-Pyramimonas_sp.AAC.1
MVYPYVWFLIGPTDGISLCVVSYWSDRLERHGGANGGGSRGRVQAFNKRGVQYVEGAEGAMANVRFVEADLDQLIQHVDADTCVVVIHGCNEARPPAPPLSVTN